MSTPGKLSWETEDCLIQICGTWLEIWNSNRNVDRIVKTCDLLDLTKETLSRAQAELAQEPAAPRESPDHVTCPKCHHQTNVKHARIDMIRDNSGQGRAECEACDGGFIILSKQTFIRPPLKSKP